MELAQAAAVPRELLHLQIRSVMHEERMEGPDSPLLCAGRQVREVGASSPYQHWSRVLVLGTLSREIKAQSAPSHLPDSHSDPAGQHHISRPSPLHFSHALCGLWICIY